MNKDANFFKLGIFVIVGVALIVTGVVILGAGALFTKYVRLEMATNSVEGLSVGSAVKYEGVAVGKVSKIEIATWRHPNEDIDKHLEIRKFIIVDLDIRRETIVAVDDAGIERNLKASIEKGLRARKGSSGLTSPPFIELVWVDPVANPPVLPPWKPDHLFIPSAPSQMSGIMNNIEAIASQLKAAQIDQVAKDVRKVLATAEESMIALKFADSRDRAVALIDEVRGTNQRIQTVLAKPEIDQAVADVSSAVAELKALVGNEQIKAFTSDLPKISARLRETLARVDEIVHDPKLQATLNNLETTSAAASPAAVDLRRLLRKIDTLMATQSQDLAAIVTGIRQMTEDAAAVANDAKSNPARVLFGEPPPPFRSDSK